MKKQKSKRKMARRCHQTIDIRIVQSALKEPLFVMIEQDVEVSVSLPDNEEIVFRISRQGSNKRGLSLYVRERKQKGHTERQNDMRNFQSPSVLKRLREAANEL